MIFSAATAAEQDGAGRHRVLLDEDWSVGGRMHGGYLLATTVRAAVSGAPEHTPDPVAVSAQYFRQPRPGPALVRTEVVRQGRAVGVTRAVLEQDGTPCVEAMVNTGTLADGAPVWAAEAGVAPEPGADAVDIGSVVGAEVFLLDRACEVRLDPASAPFLTGRTGPPRLRLWVRPRGEPADLLFALLAGDIAMPTTFNLGRYGWAPTVQLTGLLRAHPAPGWLAVSVVTHAVHGGWFDEDATITDSSGRIVCQARQLALVPR